MKIRKCFKTKGKVGKAPKQGRNKAQNHAEIAGGHDALVEMEHNFEEHLVLIF